MVIKVVKLLFLGLLVFRIVIPLPESRMAKSVFGH
jgi:hypothetical protein